MFSWFAIIHICIQPFECSKGLYSLSPHCATNFNKLSINYTYTVGRLQFYKSKILNELQSLCPFAYENPRILFSNLGDFTAQTSLFNANMDNKTDTHDIHKQEKKNYWQWGVKLNTRNSEWRIGIHCHTAIYISQICNIWADHKQCMNH